MKICKQCGQEKGLDHFYAHKRMADGYLNKCKECVKARVRKHRSENRDRFSEYERSRYMNPSRIEARRKYAQSPAGKLAKRRADANYADKYPDRKAANRAVSSAIRSGRMKRMPCEVCGEKKAEAHHDDYSKKLDVRWLCAKHHADTRRRHGYTKKP